MITPEREQKRLGTGMFVMGWLIFMVLIGLWFNDVLEDQRNPNQTLSTSFIDGAREVILQRNRFGHYVTSGTINGRDVTFMLDTGATTIAIPRHWISPSDSDFRPRPQTGRPPPSPRRWTAWASTASSWKMWKRRLAPACGPSRFSWACLSCVTSNSPSAVTP